MRSHHATDAANAKPIVRTRSHLSSFLSRLAQPPHRSGPGKRSIISANGAALRTPHYGSQTWESKLKQCHSKPFLMSLQNLSRKFDSWDSRGRLIQLRFSYENGVSATRIDSTYPNGCLRSGESVLMHIRFPRGGRNSPPSQVVSMWWQLTPEERSASAQKASLARWPPRRSIDSRIISPTTLGFYVGGGCYRYAGRPTALASGSSPRLIAATPHSRIGRKAAALYFLSGNSLIFKFFGCHAGFGRCSEFARCTDLGCFKTLTAKQQAEQNLSLQWEHTPDDARRPASLSRSSRPTNEFAN